VVEGGVHAKPADHAWAGDAATASR
jgi:hypothetical protein